MSTHPDLSRQGLSRHWSTFEIRVIYGLMVRNYHKVDPTKRASIQYLDFASALNRTLHGNNMSKDIPLKEVVFMVKLIVAENKGTMGFLERNRSGHLTRGLLLRFMRKLRFTGSKEEWEAGRKEREMGRVKPVFVQGQGEVVRGRTERDIWGKLIEVATAAQVPVDVGAWGAEVAAATATPAAGAGDSWRGNAAADAPAVGGASAADPWADAPGPSADSTAPAAGALADLPGENTGPSNGAVTADVWSAATTGEAVNMAAKNIMADWGDETAESFGGGSAASVSGLGDDAEDPFRPFDSDSNSGGINVRVASESNIAVPEAEFDLFQDVQLDEDTDMTTGSGWVSPPCHPEYNPAAPPQVTNGVVQNAAPLARRFGQEVFIPVGDEDDDDDDPFVTRTHQSHRAASMSGPSMNPARLAQLHGPFTIPPSPNATTGRGNNNLAAQKPSSSNADPLPFNRMDRAASHSRRSGSYPRYPLSSLMGLPPVLSLPQRITADDNKENIDPATVNHNDADPWGTIREAEAEAEATARQAEAEYVQGQNQNGGGWGAWADAL